MQGTLVTRQVAGLPATRIPIPAAPASHTRSEEHDRLFFMGSYHSREGVTDILSSPFRAPLFVVVEVEVEGAVDLEALWNVMVGVRVVGGVPEVAEDVVFLLHGDSRGPLGVL